MRCIHQAFQVVVPNGGAPSSSEPSHHSSPPLRSTVLSERFEAFLHSVKTRTSSSCLQELMLGLYFAFLVASPSKLHTPEF